MSDQDKILHFLRSNGPTLPSKVAKLLNTQILLASAHLSDLSAQGKVKVSHLKVGGSPLYYLPGQESQLYPFAAGNINPKDLQVLERLRTEKVLQESILDLLHKVSLRSLQDFAIPLQVSHHDKTELFWKWHLLSPEETNQRLSNLLVDREAPSMQPAAAAENSLLQKQEAQKTLIPSEPDISPQPLLELQEALSSPLLLTEEALKDEVLVADKKPFFPKVKEKIVHKKRVPVQDTFLPAVEHFCKKLKIEIEQKETLRKNAEINLMVKVPSVVGSMRYLCKAKNKTKCDEKDLSAAYMEAQIKKLPLLFLYSDTLTKKALEMLESGAFDNIVVKKVE